MKNRYDLLPEEAEQAALFALGCLDDQEAEACRQRMKDSASFEAEIVSLHTTLSQIGDLIPRISPPASLKSRLMKRVGTSSGAQKKTPAAQPWKSWPASPASTNLTIVRGEDSGWKETPYEGVSVKRLFVDRARDRVTMLVRMAAGFSYPAHVHVGPEECYVLEGDLQGESFSLAPGDYQFAEAGSRHGRQYTNQGCLLLIISSLQDYILPENERTGVNL